MNKQPTLDFIQQAVGGSIEMVHNFTKYEGQPVTVVYANEDARRMNLKFNPLAPSSTSRRMARLSPISATVEMGWRSPTLARRDSGSASAHAMWLVDQRAIGRFLGNGIRPVMGSSSVTADARVLGALLRISSAAFWKAAAASSSAFGGSSIWVDARALGLDE